MDITNRSLALVAVAAFVLVACAVLMTVVALPVEVELRDVPSDRVAVIPDVLRDGGAEVQQSGPLTVRIERGVDADSVLLVCDQYKAGRPVEARRVVFPSVPLGDCSIRLVGTDHGYGPVFPGDDVRCGAEDRRTRCTGGLAHSRAGSLTVTSVVPAELAVDGVDLGPAPVEDVDARVGKHHLRVEYADGRYAEWSLVVAPDQVIEVHFPPPPPVKGPSGPGPRAAAASPP